MLEPDQETLLRALVDAARAVPKTPFVVAPVADEAHTLRLSHPGLREPCSVYRGDLLALEDERLIRPHDRRAASDYDFDLTAAGFRAAEASPAPGGLTAPTDSRKRWGRWVALDEKPFKTSAMSAIWRVRDETDDTRTRCALKELRYPKGRGSIAYRRFVREIETLATGRLSGKHPGIVQVLDHTVPADGDVRAPFYVMPLADGSLQDAAKYNKGQLEAVLRLVLPVVDALEAAHKEGVIHRDIKPGNILVFGDQPVLADFGILFLEDEERMTKTEHGTVGTDEFVAPELLGGGKADPTPAADVYSLAKTLFAVVSGGDVFPREWVNDPRFDLAEQLSDRRLQHLRGLMERMVTEDPERRPQSMADVRVLFTLALDNLRDNAPYREGMYAGTTAAVARAAHLRRLLAGPATTARNDGVRGELRSAAAAAGAIAADYASIRHSMPVNKVYEPGATAAAAAAEELLAVGLPLLAADERAYFESWLAAAVEPLTRFDGQQYAQERLVMHPAGVLAAYGAGALAWQQWRLEIFRQVVDRYVADGSAWLHHTLLGDSSAALHPWVVAALASSEVLRAHDETLASDPMPAVGMLGGVAVLKYLAGADPTHLREFITKPRDIDFPIPFAPGLLKLEWVSQLVELGLRGGPDERDFARAVFDMTAEEFRALCGRLTVPLMKVSGDALRRMSRVPYFSMGVDPQLWKRWTGVEIMPRDG